MFPVTSFASSSSVISISATVNDNGQGGNLNPNPNPGPGSGGGGIIETYTAPTDVTLSGLAYPNAKVILLSSGIQVLETKADANALFSFKLSSLASGLKIFSVVAEDSEGKRSSIITIPIIIKDNTSTVISNLFTPPSLSLDKLSYDRTENILIHGYSVPNSTVIISLDSVDTTKTIADNLGLYTFSVKADSISLGRHVFQTRTQIVKNMKTEESGFSQLSSFTNLFLKQTKDINKTPSFLVADVNHDSIVNIVDFSILAFYYKKSNVPKNIDLNGDGKIDMADFSILAYHWNA